METLRLVKKRILLYNQWACKYILNRSLTWLAMVTVSVKNQNVWFTITEGETILHYVLRIKIPENVAIFLKKNVILAERERKIPLFLHNSLHCA